MPKLAIESVGPRTVPQEIRDLRQSSIDFHEELGQPVIFKHKWNEDDLREGRAVKCPFHDTVYESDSDWDEYCFGTGYLGGWANGEIVYVSIADAQENVFRLNDQGILMHDSHPQMTAPWNPPMGDGDIIITAEFDPLTWDVLNTYERYQIQEVTPTTMRGPGFKSEVRGKLYVVNQTAQIDRIPRGNVIYDVPVDFDYGNVPVIPVDPNVDPDDFPPDTQFSAFEVAIRLTGFEPGLRSEYEQDIRLQVAGSIASYEQSIRLTGSGGGTHIILDSTEEDSPIIPVEDIGELNLPLVPWEGGPAYWNQFPAAAAAGWTDPEFFPIAVFLGKPTQGHPQALADVGINILAPPEHTSPGMIDFLNADLTDANMFIVATQINPYQHDFIGDPEDWQQITQPGWDRSDFQDHPLVVGWFLSDEPDMEYGGWPGDGVTNRNQFGFLEAVQGQSALADTPEQDFGGFKMVNFGNGVLNTFWSPDTLADMVAEVDAFGTDKYCYTSPFVRFEYGRTPDWQAASGAADAADAEAKANSSAAYGWMVTQMRNHFQNMNDLKPHWAVIEVKMPFLEETGRTIITHAQREGAIWSQIINEARGISYFDHNGSYSAPNPPAIDPNTGVAPTDEVYTLVLGPQTYKDSVRDFNERIRELAPILNTQSYEWDFTQYGSPRMDTMLKVKEGHAYIFAMVGPGGTTGNKTFTLPEGIRGTEIEVLYESRTINVNTGQFSDTFVNEYDCHIYKIPLEGSGEPYEPPPPEPPALPDNFNIGTGPLSENWTADVLSQGHLAPLISSNRVTNIFGGNRSAWWNVDTFGPDVEVNLTIAVWTGASNAKGVGLFARLTDAGTAGVDGYLASFEADSGNPTHDIVVLSRFNNGTQTFLAFPAVTNYEPGDIVALRIVGSVLTARRNRGGVWTDLVQHTDVAPLTGAGHVGMFLNEEGTSAYDDFNAVTL
jgi:hypothetical protein